jgi:predicted DNA-binding protein
MSGRKKEYMGVYVDEAQAERLRRLSARTRVPMSVYIRDAVEVVLLRYDQQPLSSETDG